MTSTPVPPPPPVANPSPRSTGRSRRWSAGVALLVTLGTAVVPIVTARGATAAGVQPVGGPATSVLSYQHEFDGASLDAATWNTCYVYRPTHCTNQWNTELQAYTPHTVTVSGGAAHLTARKQAVTGYLEGGTPSTFGYSSGMISSHGKASFQYGYAEFRARVPKGQGIWPALWLLPESRSWPPEIDIMEYIGSQPDRVYMTNHASDGTGAKSFAYVGPDFSQDWHTYAIDWKPSALTFYVDGVQRGQVTVGVPRQPMYLLANVAVGGTWPGSPDASTSFPATMDIDYLRVWDAGQGRFPTPQAPPVAAPAPSTPAPAPPAASPTPNPGPPVVSPVPQPPSAPASPSNPAPEGTAAGFADDFSASTIDRSRWPSASSAVDTGSGRLQIPSTGVYPAIGSGLRDFRNTSTSLKVVQAPSSSSSELFLNVGRDEANQVSIYKSGGKLFFRSTQGGQSTTAGTIPFDQRLTAHWRIVNTQAGTQWLTSPDGLRWTSRRTAAPGPDQSNARVQLRSGDWMNVTGGALLDDLVVRSESQWRTYSRTVRSYVSWPRRALR